MARLPAWLTPLGRLQWMRGMRAGIAVAISMLVCHRLAIPVSWSALGAFECVIVDNGGPYRTRFQTIAVLLIGGGLCAVLASFVAAHLAAALAATAVVCFVFTYLRAAGDPFTSSSIIVLVIFFVGLSHPAATLQEALYQACLFVFGGLGAAILCLLFWPIFPFRPARQSIARCYGVLAELVSASASTSLLSGPTSGLELKRVHELQYTMRSSLEEARHALGNVRARSPARTIRGQSLAILLETAEVLFGRAIAIQGLLTSERSNQTVDGERLGWMKKSALLVQTALQQEWSSTKILTSAATLQSAFGTHPQDAQLQEWFHCFEAAINAAAATSSGVDPLFQRKALSAVSLQIAQMNFRPRLWVKFERLRQNWTYQSSTFRHALRSGAVCTASVLLARVLHLQHGDWMSLTAIIVLQPWMTHTWNKALQRVGGTMAGGVLAALLSIVIHSPIALIAAVSLTSFFTLALFTVDYALYSFFLTPTFVLLANTRSHSWEVAAIRGFDTLLGALIALAASKFLFVQAEHIELRRLFAKVLSLQAAYLEQVGRFWSLSGEEKASAEKLLLIPDRRAVGLANNEAEESLDRMMLEASRDEMAASLLEHGLAFTTYSRSLAQACTALAAKQPANFESIQPLHLRLQEISALLYASHGAAVSKNQFPDAPITISDAMQTPSSPDLQRIAGQIDVLERSARALIGAP